MSRLKNSFRNTLFSITLSLTTILIGLISQRIFIKVLGADYLGINGLFTSIVSMLALVELGLGSAVYFHLYKPFAHNEKEKIRSLVNFYKSGYRIIATSVLVLGLLIIPFLKGIVGNTSIQESILIIYFLFLADIIFSYLLTYKRAVLYVDQKNYLINIVHLGYLLLLNVSQIIILYSTRSFYLYLTAKIIMRLLENVVLTLITNKKYPYLQGKNFQKLDKQTKGNIYKKIRGLAYHKVGNYIVLGTDEILISKYLGIVTVGLYTNYLLVIKAITMIIGQAFDAVTASIGNLLVTSEPEKSHDIYKKITFINVWLSCIATSMFLVSMHEFIVIWVGGKYLLSQGVLLALSINLYFTLIRSAISSYKDASGIYHEDRFVPIIESVVNLALSIVLLHYIGLAGVFIGTAGSTLILHLFSYPKYVYKQLFAKSYSSYYFQFAKYTTASTLTICSVYLIANQINIESPFLLLIVKVLISAILPNIIFYFLFRDTAEYKFYKTLIFKGLALIKSRLSWLH